MQITVQVSEEMRREAEARGLPVIDFYTMLIDRGRDAVIVRGLEAMPCRHPMAGFFDRIRTSCTAAFGSDA